MNRSSNGLRAGRRSPPAFESGSTLLVPAAAGLALIGGYVAALLLAMERASFDVWPALIVGPVLIVLTLPVAGRLARVEADPRLTRIVMVALVLKLLASLVRYVVAFEVYDGAADASIYLSEGQRLAHFYRQGVFGADVGVQVIGTGFIRVLTGLVFTVVGPSDLAAFLVFSWLGFWGLYWFYRAFRVAVPDGDHRRYALLTFLLPSLLYWPSSVGKEAWMALTLGLSAYGAARLLDRGTAAGRRGVRGLLPLVLGLAGTGLVRPHMGVLVTVSLSVAYLLRRSHGTSSLGPLAKVVGFVFLAGLSVVAVERTERFFGVQDQGAQGVEAVLDQTAERTNQGGSSFEATKARSPAQLPKALFTVLFRPLPTEAHNAQMLVAAAEGSLLLGLVLVSARRLASVPRLVWRNAYVAFAGIYTVLFAAAFSSFGNFGILTRQRVQVFPLVLVLLAVPFTAPRPSHARVRN